MNDLHTGQQIKDVFRRYKITDDSITSLTPFDQSFLSRIYTSREIQPRYLKNFLYIINKIYDLNLTTDQIFNNNLIEA